MPYTVSMTYNSCLGGQYYKSNYVITPIESPSTGMGFKMSYDETIKQINQNENDELFVWADADGTEHYFSWQDFKVANKTVRGLCDEDGLGLYLEPEYNDVANDYSIQGYMLSDEVGNKKHFDSAGYLDYIEDTNGNRRIFVRSTIDHKVESISLSPHMSDDSFMQLQMTYSPSGMLNKITNTQTGMIATMHYSSTYNGTVSTTASGYLRKIVYTYATVYTYTVTFEYNSSGKLIMAKDLTTNMAIHYTYSTAGKVSYMKQYANATETSTTATMTLGKQAHMFYSTLYSYYRTYGKDGTAGTADDIYTYYRFDYRGRVISTYTKDLNTLYGAGNCIYEDDSSVKTKNSISSVMQLSGNTVNYLLNPGFEDQNPGGSEEIPKHWTITETGLYYLQSRYYNPQWGRFLNADFAEVICNGNTLTDKNLYAYCDNNPVMRSDANGEFWHLIIGAAVGATLNIVGALMDGETDATSLIIAGLSGAASGLLSATGACALLQIVGSAAISGIEELVSQGFEQGFDKIDYLKVGCKTISGAISGIGTGLDSGTAKHLMTAGKQSTKRVAGVFAHKGFKAGFREIPGAAKRYFSQTNTLFYCPLIRETLEDITETTVKKLPDFFTLSVS